MTKKDFGEITRIIREDILKLSQDELATEIGSAQSLVSRMERGQGTIDHLLSLLDYYKKKGLKTHMIFYEPFQKELLVEDTTSTNVDQVLHVAQHYKETLIADFNKLILMLNTL